VGTTTEVRDGFADVLRVEARPFAEVEREERETYAAGAAAERATHPLLETGNMLNPMQLNAYRAATTTLRFKRVRALVEGKASVLDIGGGEGLIGGQLLRDCGLTTYTGIDLTERFPTQFQRMLDANGLVGAADIEVQTKDLYTLDSEWVARRSPDIALCFEVLEHVPDAESALRTIADSLPEGCERRRGYGVGSPREARHAGSGPPALPQSRE
jgi:2-polyprenyl-3-methyl-5-hydroxy-6-metoxy-1,4-benzoquinol methylase